MKTGKTGVKMYKTAAKADQTDMDADIQPEIENDFWFKIPHTYIQKHEQYRQRTDKKFAMNG